MYNNLSKAYKILAKIISIVEDNIIKESSQRSYARELLQQTVLECIPSLNPM